MTKFAKNTEFKNKVINAVRSLNISNIEVGGVPLAVGDKLVIDVTQPLKEQTFNGVTWLPISTVDGGTISAKQLVRSRNGLKLTATSFEERLAEAFMLCDDNGKLSLQIVNIRTKEFSNEDGGTTISNYYIFNLL